MTDMSEQEELLSLVVYVPVSSADDVRAALAAAGAGRIGAYSGCSFSSSGTGRFVPLEGALPAIGSVGEMAEVAEERIEVVVQRTMISAVLQALKKVHPYEQPVILLTRLLDAQVLMSDI